MRFIVIIFIFLSAQLYGIECHFIHSLIESLGIKIKQVSQNPQDKPVHAGSNGVNNDGIYQGKMGDTDIVIKALFLKYDDPKVNEIELNAFMNELRIYQELSELSLSPKLFGVAEFSDGKFGIISQKINNSWLAHHSYSKQNQLPQSLAKSSPLVQKKWQENMSRIVTQLTILGYKATDLQFLIDKNGNSYVIDFAAYSKSEDPKLEQINQNFLVGILSQFPS